MGSYWRSLRRADRIAIVSLTVTVVLGFLAVVPAYLAFFTTDGAAGSGHAVSAAGRPNGPAAAAEPETEAGTGADDTPRTYLGKWKGSGVQDGDAFPIYLDISGGVAGATFGEMFFPINECRFELVLVHVKGAVLTMQAELVNRGRCFGARATLTTGSGGTLTYRVPQPGNPGVAIVEGVLSRYSGDIPTF